MIRPEDIFDEIRGNRAQCPAKDRPMDCDGEKRKQGPVQINETYAHCHVCTGHWRFEEKKRTGPSVVPPPKVTPPTRKQISAAVKKSAYSESRKHFLDHSDTILEELSLPWNETAHDDIYGVGVRRDKEKNLQLVFKINDNHVKYHKGTQFGDKKCKVYPNPSYLGPHTTLYLVEGEKDAITANCHGVPAVTFTTGAGALPSDLAGIDNYENLVICYDNDDPGKEGARKIARALFKKMQQIKILNFNGAPEKYDLTDYFMNHTKDEFLSLVDEAPVFGRSPVDLGGMPAYSPSEFADKFKDPPKMVVDSLLYDQDILCLAGSTNVGKSVFGLQLTTSLAMGVPLMGQFKIPKPKKVLHVQFELKDEAFAGLLKATSNHIMDEYPVEAPRFEKNCTFLSSGQRDLFTDKYEQIEANLMFKQYDVLVIDNLYTSTDVDISRNDKLTDLIRRIVNLKKEYNVAMVMISHHKKTDAPAPLDIAQILGGTSYTNHMDFIAQFANTKRAEGIKVMKITKVRAHSSFHNMPLALKLHNYKDDDNKQHLYFQYLKPLPKNEMFWYADPKESDEERVLKAIPTESNFSWEQFQAALEATLNLTSQQTAYNWLDKMIDQGLISKIERGHYRKISTEIDAIFD